MVDEELIYEIKHLIREKSREAEDEIKGLIEAAENELELNGVYGSAANPVYRQAIRLYCKAHYGYDENTERFEAAYKALRDSMSLSGDFAKGGTNGSNIDMA